MCERFIHGFISNKFSKMTYILSSKIAELYLAIISLLGVSFFAVFSNSEKNLRLKKIFISVISVFAMGLGVYLVDDFKDFSQIAQLLCFEVVGVSGFLFLTYERLLQTKTELIILLFTSTLGSVIMLKSTSFLTLYLGLELQSIPFYAVVLFRNRISQEYLSSEGSLKYFILGAISSCLLLYGISLIYGSLVSQHLDFTFEGLKTYLSMGEAGLSYVFILGCLLFVSGLLFKLSAFPFHFWAPDVYSAAGTLSLNFIANVPKISAFVALFNFVQPFKEVHCGFILTVLTVCGLASVLIGAVGGVRQLNIRRILAYSGILNSGFVLLAVANQPFGEAGVILNYLIIYTLANIGVFSVLNRLVAEGFDIENNQNLAGLSKVKPYTALGLSILLLSLAGIPPFAGFFAKFYVVQALVNSHLYIPASLALLASVAACFYYLNLIKIMYFTKYEGGHLNCKCNGWAGVIYLFIFIAVLGSVIFVIKPDFLI
jgi:NADH-quinone oxidoreductase subunit N